MNKHMHGNLLQKNEMAQDSVQQNSPNFKPKLSVLHGLLLA